MAGTRSTIVREFLESYEKPSYALRNLSNNVALLWQPSTKKQSKKVHKKRIKKSINH